MRAPVAGRALCILSLWAITGLPVSAQMTDHMAALRAYEEGQLDQALTLFERALRTTRDHPVHLADVYLHLGILKGLRGDTAAAQLNYEYALALVPSLEAPIELGPRDRETFLRALQLRAGREFRIELDVNFDPNGTGPPQVNVRVSGAPDGLLARTRVVALAEGHELWTRESVPGQSAAPDNAASSWDRSKALTLRATALNEFGAELVENSTTIPARATRSVPSAAETAHQASITGPLDSESPERRGHKRRSVFSSPWFWVATVAVIGGGATAGYFLARPDDRIFVQEPTFAVRE